jgi:hypothetical protein
MLTDEQCTNGQIKGQLSFLLKFLFAKNDILSRHVVKSAQMTTSL